MSVWFGFLWGYATTYQDSRMDYYDMDIDEEPVIPERPSRAEEDIVRHPVRFYHRNEPYYEFANFAPYHVMYNGQRYPTAEHLFQAHKFLTTHPHLAERIRRCPTPRAALQEAGRMRRLQRVDWFDVNVGIMESILDQKFAQHPRLERMLLDTGDREIIEASPVDEFWGAGEDGLGRNELGKALVRVRDKLRQRVGATCGESRGG